MVTEIKTGNQLKQWRLEQGLTQKQAANKLKYRSGMYISELERSEDEELAVSAQKRIAKLQEEKE